MMLVPISLREANAFVEQWHRHHGPARGYKFALAASLNGDNIVGVAIVGRPVSRMFDDGWTLEVNRTCTDGTKNVNSFLYAAAWRVTRAMGYRRLVTYTLKSESQASLKAAGWTILGKAGGGSWSRKSRPRVDMHPLQQKLLWEKAA